MMVAMSRIAALLALSLSAVSTVSVPAVSAEPAASEKWTVDFADSHCQASRTFDTSAKPVTMAIKPPLLGGPTRVTFSGKITKLTNLEPRGAIDFEDGGPSLATDFHAVLISDGFGLIADLAPSDAARLRRARALSVRAERLLRGRLETGAMESLFRTLDRCVEDLRQRVGAGAKAPLWVQQARPPSALDPLFSASKFWTVEVRHAKTNEITAQLLVDKAGDVRECAIVASSGSAGLDIQTCQVFEQRVRYSPALDASGKAVASVVTETVKWRR